MAIRLTESRLRQIIREEAHKVSRKPQNVKKNRRTLKEGNPGADEDLANAMIMYVESWMDESGVEDPQAACDTLRREVDEFCIAFVESY